MIVGEFQTTFVPKSFSQRTLAVRDDESENEAETGPALRRRRERDGAHFCRIATKPSKA
jgi:hypothetical protein